ncbi:ExeA family protein [Tundrisphaera lichenicola]|uniref:ExeA family protein n=1 Tax=Tundrisphaera lichenicola TaxID=2029860 RepID=UPI003EBEB506
MYEEHFGLRPRPFGAPSSLPAHVALPSRDAVLRRLRYGLEHGRGPALLFGPPGTGKTLMARSVAHELGGRAVHLAFPAMPAADLMAYLADELAAPDPTLSGLGGSVRRLRACLASSAMKGERPLLIVDEAHLIDDPSTFETLRLLLNFATLGPPDLALLIVGGPEVLLRLPRALTDRLTARCLLSPLTLEESSAYVLGRLQIAGATSPLFDPDSLAELHRSADGLPRRLDRLADLALLIAYAQEAPQPDLATARAAAREANLDALAA